MKRKNKRGFTLIELMIVLAIIGVLSVVLIPKALPMKDGAKNNAVQANVYIVRSFLENRAGADKTNIENDTKTLMRSSSTALSNIQSKIKIDMDTAFTVNKDMKNPFNNNTIIDISSVDVLANINMGSAAVIIGYNVGGLPGTVSSISTTIKTPGVIAIIVYQTGYVVYGVDSLGEIVQPTLVKMPSRVAQTPITNPTTPKGKVEEPTFSYTFDSKGGNYTLNCGTPNATIIYTTDRSKPVPPSPSSSSTIYAGTIPVKISTVINAYAFVAGDKDNAGLNDSNVVSTIYTLPPIVPTPSPSFSFNGNFGVGNKIAINSIVTFSINFTPGALIGTMEVKTDKGVVIVPDSNGVYTFTAPSNTSQICTITATVTKDTQQFEGKLILTTN